MYKNQLIPILDPKTNKKIDYEKRKVVHEKGLWHPTIQAYIFQKREGKIKTLIQKRTNLVDISTNKFDQSLAVHILKSEENNPIKALKRGLFQELGIDIKETKYSKVLKNINISIVKNYSDNPYKNKEVLSLFFVLLGDNQKLKINTEKIDKLEWIDFEKLLEKQRKEPQIFTKTSRFYCVDQTLKKILLKDYLDFFNKKDIKINPKTDIRFFSDPNSENDISIMRNDKNAILSVYNKQKQFSITQKIIKNLNHLPEEIKEAELMIF